MKMNFEQKLRQLSPEFQAQFFELQKKAWEETKVEHELLSGNFNQYKIFSLSHCYPKSLGMTDSGFYTLFCYETVDYNLTELVNILNSFEPRTRIEFIQYFGSAKAKDFDDFFNIRFQLTEYVNSLLDPICESIMNKCEVSQRLSMNGRTIKLN